MPSLVEQKISRRRRLLLVSENLILTGILFLGALLPPLASEPLVIVTDAEFQQGVEGVTLGQLLRGLLTSFAIAIVSQTSLGYNDLYDWRTAQDRAQLRPRLTHACGHALVMLAVLVLLVPGDLFVFPTIDGSSQTWKLILLLLLSFAAILGFRHVFHWQLRSLLAVGDTVITIGGMHGTVHSLDDEQVVLVVDDIRVVFDRTAVSRVVRDGAGTPEQGGAAGGTS